MILRIQSDFSRSSIDRRFGIRITSENLKILLAECLASDGNETGGILIGRYSSRHDTAVITKIGKPPMDSESFRRMFRRGTHGLQELLDRLWPIQEYYLGEWHYHPCSSATSSSADREQMQRISESSGYCCPEPILLIVGGNPTEAWEVAAQVFPRGEKPVRLDVRTPKEPNN